MIKIPDRAGDPSFARITLPNLEGIFWVRNGVKWCEVSDASWDNNIHDDKQYWEVRRSIDNWRDR